MVVKAADYLRDRFQTATAYVHHTGKDPEKGARGHSALFAAADLVLRVMDNCATVEKVRDGVAGERFGFQLEPIELGRDPDGDPVMTCLLNESDGTPKSKDTPKGLGKNQKQVLDALRTLAADSGERSAGSSAIPAGVLLVRFEALCARLEPKFPAMKPWQVKKRVNEALIGLEGSNLAGIHGDLVWLR